MVVPELRPWRGARPHVERIADAVRPSLARVGDALRRSAGTGSPQVRRGSRPKPGLYTATAATAGLALAVGVVTVSGPWDSSGQRTAERDRAVALEAARGADHGSTRGRAGTPRETRTPPSAPSVLTGLGGTATTVQSAPRGKALAGVLDPLLKTPALGRHSASVVDVATGRRLYGTAPGTPLTPASTIKIVTAAAALSALGPDHRLTTRATYEPDTNEVVLVGGGDPTLTARKKPAPGAARLSDLAERTAAALAKRGVRKVTLSYDETLYPGDRRHPIGENTNIAEITPLMTDEARTDDSGSGAAPRVPDPAADAARTFGELLRKHGVQTSPPGPSKSSSRAATLASVSSPPLSALVERMLTNSDNDIAEALARHTAIATGKRADFAGASAAVRAQLQKLKVPLKGAVLRDGSGLDRRDRLTADLLTSLLVKAADPAHPELRPVLTGLPVAGFTGTLSGRYADGAGGVVRAKTGTLTGVNTLAGTVVDRDGRLLAFAFLGTGTDRGAAQNALDKAATALAGCGCR
ncbi:D-alanyl-D-alanine carboxypeptidase/D-alanyl-D-alanine endopeptidase [Streptomyces thermocarboxydovorans]|uniref:D-alanyl-D-alanine carboxypeptidase/D-alanyl-D-alanine endopeptidase n=1 Tax=Streptomyces thermocarboxydovorans TaxID=59298 RepID=UPI0031E13FB9